ncbi:beta-N-acetylhexosaminidase [Naasia sp. SYSU D00948]|uniref:beta-N-acetylhexosaminidase n=1 Tax=Naasia sp. SYSU D00948 TaxID=2817379 RepID=UPI001B3041E2|nr:beta-N-acetylhexosaminidase [Naasia sp. SYSU D00948]
MDLGLVPQPARIEVLEGTLLLGSTSQVHREIDRSLPPEGYVLEVGPDAVSIRGGSDAGVFYGVQTLLQLLPPERLSRPDLEEALAPGPVRLPRVLIEDSPAHPWRGFLVDVARHFFPVEFLLATIDQLAAHKLNVLHLHLTDDQGWRLPVPGYPLLTELGGWRSATVVGFDHPGADVREDGLPHGGAYTREELELVVAYAAQRHVTVLPEVDLPGHVEAAIAAYPELGNGARAQVRTRWGVSTRILNLEESTLRFVREVLAEVMDIFPGPFVHSGGDEVPKKEWIESPAVQRKRRELGLPDEEALQGWFTARIDDIVRERGRRLVAWDEVVDGGAPQDILVMAWRTRQHGIDAALAGYDVVMTPSEWVYLDHRQSRNPDEPVTFPDSPLPLARVFAFEPVPPGARERLAAPGAGRVLGAQANLWTEYVPGVRQAEYMTYPRLCAFAEAVWRSPLAPGQHRDFADFHRRLSRHTARLEAAGIGYRRFDTASPLLELEQLPPEHRISVSR